MIMNKISGRSALEGLGLDLKAAREGLAQSQRQLAARTGFQQPQIARAEKGADVRLSTLIEMARALGLEVKLVPQAVVSTVQAMSRSETSEPNKPLYSLDTDE
jgi:predicted transcriptional regulator